MSTISRPEMEVEVTRDEDLLKAAMCKSGPRNDLVFSDLLRDGSVSNQRGSYGAIRSVNAHTLVPLASIFASGFLSGYGVRAIMSLVRRSHAHRSE